MDDNTNPSPQPIVDKPADEFTIPVTVTKQESPKPTGAPNVPLETVELPDDNVPPPAPVSDPQETQTPVPPAPLATTSPASQNIGANIAPSGKTLQELLAEEEASSPQTDMSKANHKNGKGKGVVILVAVLLAAALIGGAAFAYIQTKNKVKPADAPAATTTQTTPESTEVKGTDIDKTTTDLDATLKKVDDTKDYTTNDLSDATLGL